MEREDLKPLILLVFANDKRAYLENITKEKDGLLELFFSLKNNFEIKELNYSTVDGVLDALNLRKERVVLLHFAGHSSTDFLQLDEGKIYAEGFANKLKSCGKLKLVFLNGCRNIELFRALVKEKIPNIIGTRLTIGDESALKFSHAFYRSLIEHGLTVEESYNEAGYDVQTEAGVDFRSLDLGRESNFGDWAWIGSFTQGKWKVEEAINPCNRLPGFSEEKSLPNEPFKNLLPYTEDDGEIFFGRCGDILELFYLVKNKIESLIVLHGGSGVGKSSFLRAGLIPRLQLVSENILYFKSETIDEAFFRIKKNKQRKFVVVLDQVEELFIMGGAERLRLMGGLIDYVSGQDNIVLVSLRTEWFGMFCDYVQKNTSAKYISYYLEALTKDAIYDVISSLSGSEKLKIKYGIEVDPQLPELIAATLLEDRKSNIAPTLQIILSKLWENTKNKPVKKWDKDLYLNLKSEGLLLADYIEQQLDKVARKFPGIESGGVILDILFNYTTEYGTSKLLSQKEFYDNYAHIEQYKGIHNELINHYLLTVCGEDQNMTKLSHDTLALIIRKNYQQSLQLGPRAQKILESRFADFMSSNRVNLIYDANDLDAIEDGRIHSRKYSKDENILIKNSHKAIRAKSKFQDVILIFVAFIAMITILIFLNGEGVSII